MLIPVWLLSVTSSIQIDVVRVGLDGVIYPGFCLCRIADLDLFQCAIFQVTLSIQLGLVLSPSSPVINSAAINSVLPRRKFTFIKLTSPTSSFNSTDESGPIPGKTSSSFSRCGLP